MRRYKNSFTKYLGGGKMEEIKNEEKRRRNKGLVEKTE